MNAHVSGRIVGYARVSTKGQDLGYQLGKLGAAGCAQIFHKKQSGKSRDNRPELARLLVNLQPGDMVLATASDRMARDPLDMVNILNTVKNAGAHLRLLDEAFIDTTSEFADVIAFLMGWAARWQRQRILENTAHGRELARHRGVKFGRKPKLGPSERQKIIDRRANGESCAKIASVFGVSESTVLRSLRMWGMKIDIALPNERRES